MNLSVMNDQQSGFIMRPKAMLGFVKATANTSPRLSVEMSSYSALSAWNGSETGLTSPNDSGIVAPF